MLNLGPLLLFYGISIVVLAATIAVGIVLGDRARRRDRDLRRQPRPSAVRAAPEVSRRRS